MDSSDNLIKISWGGDAMCLGPELDAIKRTFGRYDFSVYLDGLKYLFDSADYAVANLETPICPSQGVTDAAIRFNTPIEFAAKLKEVGFDFLSTANNHCLDRGEDGISETIHSLDALGIEHAGTYASKDASEKIFVKEIKGVTFAIVCATFGTNSQHNGVMLPNESEWKVDLLKKQAKPKRFKFDPNAGGNVALKYLADDVSPLAIDNSIHKPYLSRICGKIKTAKTMADVVIAVPHIGGQYNPGPGEYAKYIVRTLKDAGADMIIAGHPHTSHRCEMLDDVFCAYSLGNLCFTPEVGFYCPNTLADYGVILHTYFSRESKKFVGFEFDVTKIQTGDDGLTRVVPVKDINPTSPLQRELLSMETDAVKRRFVSDSKVVDKKLS